MRAASNRKSRAGMLWWLDDGYWGRVSDSFMRERRTKEKADKLTRLMAVEKMMMIGAIQSEIVRKTKIPQQTVSRLMEEVKATWMKECAQSVEETKNRFLRENFDMRERLHRELDDPEEDVVRVAEALGGIQTREMKLLGLDKRTIRLEDGTDYSAKSDGELDSVIDDLIGKKEVAETPDE